MSKKHDPVEALGPVLEKEDEELVEGIKLLLKSRNEERLQALARWPGELTDPDFPRSEDALSVKASERNKRLLAELKERFQADMEDFDKDVLKGGEK